MLVSVIQIKNTEEAKIQIEASKDLCDAFEFRLDYAQEKIDFIELNRLKEHTNLPIIFTLRKKSQGGFYSGDETERLKKIRQLCELSPNFLDIEYDTCHSFIKEIHMQYPNIKLISSFHDFEQTPTELQHILNRMILPEFNQYKIATFAKNTSDALRMLNFVKENEDLNLSGICMGPCGAITRILGPIFGNELNFASLHTKDATAPGQLSLNELNETYHFKTLNKKTQIFALLGDPVDKSAGHIFHNDLMRSKKQNSVYVKLKTSEQQLPEVLSLCRKLKFSGFSVTMPLKEVIVPYLDSIHKSCDKINAVNTIVVDKKGYWTGFNTDGAGAIGAIKAHLPHLKDKKIVILGAGGSAKAIAQAALNEGATVLILNRTLKKAVQLAQMLGCLAQPLQSLHSSEMKMSIAEIKKWKYDILINTLPIETLEQNHTSSFVFQEQDFIPNTVVMDIVYNPPETEFLKVARKAGCICIQGTEMFVQQALLQAALYTHRGLKFVW